MGLKPVQKKVVETKKLKGINKVVETIKLKGGWTKQILELKSGRRYPKFLNPAGGPSFASLSGAEEAAGMKLAL